MALVNMSDRISTSEKLKRLCAEKNDWLMNIVMEIAWINIDVLVSCLQEVKNIQVVEELKKLQHVVEEIHVELKLGVKSETINENSCDPDLNMPPQEQIEHNQSGSDLILEQEIKKEIQEPVPAPSSPIPPAPSLGQALPPPPLPPQQPQPPAPVEPSPCNKGSPNLIEQGERDQGCLKEEVGETDKEEEEFLPQVKFAEQNVSASHLEICSKSTSSTTIKDRAPRRRKGTRPRHRNAMATKSPQPRKKDKTIKLQCKKSGSSEGKEKPLQGQQVPNSNYPRMCDRCGKMFKSQGSLYTHVRLHREKDANMTHSCSLCSKKFKMRAGLRCHMKTAHSSHKDFQCTFCGKCFVARHVLTMHLRTHNGEKPYSCHVCSKSFSLACNLRRHYKIHTGEKPFKCTFCDKAFNQSHSLKVHVRTHTGDKFKCSFCDKAFTQRSYLKQHTEREHSLDGLASGAVSRTFECLHCGKIFMSERSLSNHTKIHTGEKRPTREKPFQCNLCQKWFATKHGLDFHKRMHTGYRPFQCTLCGKTFTRDISLKMHLNIHQGKEFKCDLCPRVFNSPSNMRRHMRSHSGLKAFKCQVCSREFGQKANLDQHMWTHKAEKKYTCEICGKGFNDKRNLVSHSKTHTKSPSTPTSARGPTPIKNPNNNRNNHNPEGWPVPIAQAGNLTIGLNQTLSMDYI